MTQHDERSGEGLENENGQYGKARYPGDPDVCGRDEEITRTETRASTRKGESDKHPRPGGLKPRSIARRRLTRREMEQGKELLPYMEYRRPKTRGECKDSIRPCPFVSCRFHLYLDVNPVTGSLKLNFPGMEVWDMPFTCALDIADMGGRTLEEVGQILNMTRERVRQLECSALKKLRTALEKLGDEIEPGETDEEVLTVSDDEDLDI